VTTEPPGPAAVPLGGPFWLWRDAAVRSAGFAIEDILRLGAPELAEQVDAGPPDGDHVDSWSQAFRQECTRLAELVDAEPFREAMAWQNARLLGQVIDPFVAEAWTSRRTSRRRQTETVLARYAQRYHCRNESIGFFGAVGWASWGGGSDGSPTHGPLQVRGEAAEVASSRVRLETWAAAAVAARWSQEPDLRRQLRPARPPSVRVRDGRVRTGQLGWFVLPAARLAVLTACDGRRTLAEVTEQLLGAGIPGLATDPDVQRQVQVLLRAGLLTLDLPVPPDDEPLERLRRVLQEVPEPAVRSRYLGLLDRLRAATDEVAAARGDHRHVAARMQRLSELVGELSDGATPPDTGPRGGLRTRTPAVLDCTNTLRVELGEELLSGLAEPLELMLTSAQWFIARVGELHLELLGGIHAGLGGGRQPLGAVAAEYWSRCTPQALRADIAPVIAELGARWQQILPVPPGVSRHQVRTEQLAPAVRQHFASAPPPWLSGRYHSPDVLLAATGAEAVRRGQYHWVLGELHCGVNTLNQGVFVRSSPDPARMLAAVRDDTADGSWMVPIFPSRWPGVTGRSYPSPELTGDRLDYLRLDPEPPPAHLRGPGVPLAELTLVRTGEGLQVESEDGRRWHPMAILGEFLVDALPDTFAPFPTARHRPRITLGRLTVAREQWRVPLARLDWVHTRDDVERYRQVRRWTRELGLPRFVFVRVPGPPKPCYVDLTSPLLLGMWAADLRREARRDPAATVTVTEMHPAPDRCWMPHSGPGRHCTSEFRLAVSTR
jgi:hypothetical protein